MQRTREKGEWREREEVREIPVEAFSLMKDRESIETREYGNWRDRGRKIHEIITSSCTCFSDWSWNEGNWERLGGYYREWGRRLRKGVFHSFSVNSQLVSQMAPQSITHVQKPRKIFSTAFIHRETQFNLSFFTTEQCTQVSNEFQNRAGKSMEVWMWDLSHHNSSPSCLIYPPLSSFHTFSRPLCPSHHSHLSLLTPSPIRLSF